MVRYGSKIVVVLVGLMALTSVVGLAAGLSVPTPPDLGSGSAAVSAPPVQVTDIEWTLNSDPTKLANVKVTFDHTGAILEQFDLYVTLKKADSTVLGTKNLQNIGINGPAVTHTFNFVADNISVSDVADIGVTVCFHVTGQPVNNCR